jgi:hypothetical protein
MQITYRVHQAGGWTPSQAEAQGLPQPIEHTVNGRIEADKRGMGYQWIIVRGKRVACIHWTDIYDFYTGKGYF